MGSSFNSFQQKQVNVKTDHIQLKSQLVVATNVRYKIQAVLDSGVIIYVFFL